MSIRTRQQTITFKRAFLLSGIEQVQPAGTYTVEIEEEAIPELSFPVYRRTATVIYLSSRPAGSTGSYEAAVIDPVDLEAALQKDAMSANSAVRSTLVEAAAEKVSEPSHRSSGLAIVEFAERFRAAGARLRRGLAG